jgi:hypothetical protein
MLHSVSWGDVWRGCARTDKRAGLSGVLVSGPMNADQGNGSYSSVFQVSQAWLRVLWCKVTNYTAIGVVGVDVVGERSGEHLVGSFAEGAPRRPLHPKTGRELQGLHLLEPQHV